MKKILKLLIGATFILTLVACSSNEVEKEKPMVPNPFVTYVTIEEAQEVLDYEIKTPETPEGYEIASIQVMLDSMLQLTYEKGDSSILYRMEATENAIDGFYKDFDVVEEEDIDGKVVTFKGNDEVCEVAAWFDGTFTYAITSVEGAPKDLFVSIIKSMK